MSNKVELHGWTDLVIPTEALFDLSSRAYKLYSYFIFRQRDNDCTYPGQKRMSEDLSSESEKWSIPTIKRALEELIGKSWVVRDRRFGTSSVTHLFKSKELCNQFRRERITSDPTISSPMIPQSDHGRSEKEYTVVKENTEGSIKEPAKPRQRDAYFDAICVVCGLDPSHLPPTTKGSAIAKVKQQLIAAKWQAEDVLRYHNWRMFNSKGPVGSIYWLVGEMAKKDWRNGQGAGVPSTIPRGMERQNRSDIKTLTPEEAEAVKAEIRRAMQKERKNASHQNAA